MADRLHGYGLLLALALGVAVPFQGTRGLYETSEGRYAEVARELRETGSYLEPTLDYRPHWTKPPATYWAIAGGLAVAGDNEWGVRAYNVVAFALTVLAVAAVGAALWDPATGWLAGLVYLSSLYPNVGAAAATADTLLALWVVLGELAYVRAWRGTASGGSRGWVCAMWALFGVAFFTKGPPALLPLVALIGFHRLAGRPFRLADPLGLLLFAAVGSWWYALEIARHPELAAYFVGKELIARSFSGEFHRNGEWYGALKVYAPILLIAPGLWLWHAVRIARREQLWSAARVALVLRRGGPGAFLLCWLFVPLVFFAFSKSRLPLYLLPLYPAIALAIARGLARELGTLERRRSLYRLAGASIAALIAIKGAAGFLPSKHDATRLYREARSAAGPEARFALYHESELYGFEFHSGREVERVSDTGTEPWSDRALDAAITGADPTRPYAIVARTKYGPAIEAVLGGHGTPFQRVPLTGWALFLIDARSGVRVGARSAGAGAGPR